MPDHDDNEYWCTVVSQIYISELCHLAHATFGGLFCFNPVIEPMMIEYQLEKFQ